MSAFFFAINLDSRPFDRAIAKRMNEQLVRFGADGAELVVKQNYAIGYQRRWSVPEEVNERQPLYDADADLWLVLHGRIDNRADLMQRFNKANHGWSDANLLMQLYKKFGESVFADLVGPFVFVIYSPTSQKLIAARDCMGGRYLVFCATENLLLLATYEMALAAHPQMGYRINPIKAVKLLTHSMDGQPASMLEGVTPLLPGESLNLQNSRLSRRQFYLPDPEFRINLASAEEYAAEFKRLLSQAVQRRLRSVGPVGSMLSGGLDSVPMTILAAQQLHDKGERLTAYSWVFEKFPEADERQFSAPVCEDFDIQASWVNCDAEWPQFDETTACNPIIPFSTPYGAFNQALFRQAQAQGSNVLLSGMGGDMYYTGVENLPYELLLKGRWQDAWREITYARKAIGSGRKFVRDYLVNPLLGTSDVNLSAPEWLNDDIRQSLHAEASWLSTRQRRARRPAQYFNVLATLEGEDMSYGRYFETTYGIERRFPFRDRDLAEFLLAIPSEQLFYNFYARPIVREAFKREFRPELQRRIGKTNFQPVITAGIKRDVHYQKWLQSADLAVAEFVQVQYLSSKSDYFKAHNHIPWQCAYYEFWKTSCYTPLANELG